MAKKQAALDQRCEAAERIVPQLLPALAGKWAIFHGDGLYDIQPDMDAAMKVAYSKFEPDDFLIVELVDDSDEDILEEYHGVNQ